MDEQYKKLVNAVFSDEIVSELANKTSVSKVDVEHICIEVIARVFGNGSDLSKQTIEHKIKQIVGNEELKNLLVRLQDKYNISSGVASKVLGEMLPTIFKRVVTLDNSMFVEPVKENKEVQYVAVKEAKPIEELKKEIKEPVIQEPSVDDVYKNIEKNVIKEEQIKQNIEVTRNTKKKISLFSKKPKESKKKPTNEVPVYQEEKRGTTLIEKICIGVVLAALIALIGTIIFLTIKQKISI